MPASDVCCPVDGTPMVEVGSHGIVDWDGRWDAQTTKFECSYHKKHTIFVTDYIEDSGAAAFTAAETAITNALKGVTWVYAPVDASYVILGDQRYKVLDDFRHVLATLAVEAFKKEVDPSKAQTDVLDEYEYIHAIEDVDDILEEYETNMRRLGWLRKK